MNTPRILTTSLLIALGAITTTSTAFADDEDKAACADLAEGDACTRGDGDPGYCIPDDSDPNILTCDDDTSGLDDAAGDGCSLGGAPSSPLGWIPLGLGMWWLSRRRRA